MKKSAKPTKYVIKPIKDWDKFFREHGTQYIRDEWGVSGFIPHIRVYFYLFERLYPKEKRASLRRTYAKSMLNREFEAVKKGGFGKYNFYY